MNPLTLGIPFLPAALRGASQLAAGGVDFLQSLTTPSTALTSPVVTSPPADQASTFASFQQRVGKELAQAGFGEALPLEIVDDGTGGIRVVSDHPQRHAIEQFLNEHPTLLQQFQQLVQQRGADASAGPLRLTIAATSGFDYSA
jgi:hypothetical protein